MVGLIRGLDILKVLFLFYFLVTSVLFGRRPFVGEFVKITAFFAGAIPVHHCDCERSRGVIFWPHIAFAIGCFTV